jgi:homospermidine synthase
VTDPCLVETRVEDEGQTLMATAPKRPEPYSWAVGRELIALAKTLDLKIVKMTGRKPEAVLKMAKRLGVSLRSAKRTRAKRQ